MNRFKRQVSPGAAVFLIVLVLAIVQWAWWRGLIYKGPTRPAGPPSGGGGPTTSNLVLQGRDYVKVDTIAGAIEPGDVDGPGYAARFDRPTGLALDMSGKLYVCDTGNHQIRVVDKDGSVSTLAGSERGLADGPAKSAKFCAPCGICLAPDGAIYVADTGNNSVRRILNGQVTTVIDQNPSTGVATGTTMPVAIAYQPASTPMLVVLDAGLGKVRLFDTRGGPYGEAAYSGSVVLAGEETSSGYKSAIPELVQIEGTEELQGKPEQPVVRHLTGWCRVGPGALLTDSAHAAVLYRKKQTAEVLAGIVASMGPVREWRDGTGDKCLFGSLSSIVSDGSHYAYVSDTSNNCIRRLTLPDFLFH